MRIPLLQLLVLAVCTAPIHTALADPHPLTGAETCALAETLLLEKQPTRAMLYLARCHQYEPSAEVRRTIAKLKKSFREKSVAPVSLSLNPVTATAHIDSGYDEDDVFVTDDDLWLAPGSYQIKLSAEGYEEATFAVVVDSGDRMLVPLSLQKEVPVKPVEIDLGEDAGTELGPVATAADPRPKKFKTLLADRYRRAPDPKLVAERSDQADSSPWPLITTVSGVALVAAGVAFHVRDEKNAALVGYGAGASLLGVAAYLFLRKDDDPGPRSTAILSIDSGALTCGLRGSW